MHYASRQPRRHALFDVIAHFTIIALPGAPMLQAVAWKKRTAESHRHFAVEAPCAW